MDNPRHCIITVRSNRTPGHVQLIGKNVMGAAIEESTPMIPVPADVREFTYMSMHLYSGKVRMKRRRLAHAQVTLSYMDVPRLSFTPPATTLTEQDKAEIKAMVREVTTEAVREALDAYIKERMETDR